jgi:hypothetical protein
MSWIRPALTGLLAAAILMLSTGCAPQPRLKQLLKTASDTANKQLPMPYRDGLAVESAHIEGDTLVLLIRNPEGEAAKVREHPRFEELVQGEQSAMQELCAWPALRPLHGTDALLTRRFVDRNDGLFFETTLPARDCPGPAH